MFKSSSLMAVLLLATAGATFAQPHNAAISAVNTQITLGYGLHEVGSSGLHSDADPAYQLRGSHQAASLPQASCPISLGREATATSCATHSISV